MIKYGTYNVRLITMFFSQNRDATDFVPGFGRSGILSFLTNPAKTGLAKFLAGFPNLADFRTAATDADCVQLK